MLVLSRKPQGSVVIADGIRVRILQVCGNRVRLGIEAPDHVRVLRAEVAQPNANSPEARASIAAMLPVSSQNATS